MKRSTKKARAEAARRGWETRRARERAEERTRRRRAREREAKRQERQREEKRQAAARRRAARKGWERRKEKRAELERAREAFERQEQKRQQEIDQEQADREERGAKGYLPEAWESGDREKIRVKEKRALYGSLFELLSAREAGASREEIRELHRAWRKKKDPLRADLTMPAWEKMMKEIGTQLALELHGPDSVWSYILS